MIIQSVVCYLAGVATAALVLAVCRAAAKPVPPRYARDDARDTRAFCPRLLNANRIVKRP